MKIIEQSVRVLYPGSLEEGMNELKRIEAAGRNCWRSEGKITPTSYRRFIESLRERGHESPLEFGEIMFDITTSRDVLAELSRHRIGIAMAVESQRYVNESKDDGGIRFIRPLFYKDFSPYYDYSTMADREYEASRKWEDAMELAEDAYNTLISMGMKNEDARKVLPNSTACRIMMKVNLRELLHIYKLRSANSAYPEMRKMMELLKTEVDRVLPGFLDGGRSDG